MDNGKKITYNRPFKVSLIELLRMSYEYEKRCVKVVSSGVTFNLLISAEQLREEIITRDKVKDPITVLISNHTGAMILLKEEAQ